MKGETALEADALKLSDQLAYERTRLAYERTMMGWVRTSTSLITFGFTVYKFFQFELAKEGRVLAGQIVSPRTFALFMIGSGLIALLLAALQHRRSMQSLRALNVKAPLSMAALLGGVIAILGILALIAAVLQG